MDDQKSVSQNSVYLLASSIAQKGLTLLYFIVVARQFGPAEQGMYSAVLSFAALFSVLIDLGLSSALTREIARDRERAREYSMHMLLLRLGIGAVVYLVMLVSAWLLGYQQLFIRLLFLAGIASLLDVVATSLWAVIRGFQNLKYEAIGGVLAIGVMVIIGGVSMTLHLPLLALVVAVLLGSSANLAYVCLLLMFRWPVLRPCALRGEVLVQLARIALPFAGAAFFSRIFTYVDIPLLARISGETFAGWYSAASKMILALHLIPASISASLYPAMSNSFRSDPTRVGFLCSRALFFLCATSLPIACGTTLLAPQLVLFFYGDAYAQTALVLQILIWALVWSFMSYPLGALLAATDRQHLNTLFFAGAAGISFFGIILVAPQYQAIGAAGVTVCVYAWLFCASMIAVYRDIAPFVSYLLLSLGKIFLASFVMSAYIVLVRSFVPLLLVIVSGAGMYIGVLLLARAVNKDEVRSLLLSIRGRSRPL